MAYITKNMNYVREGERSEKKTFLSRKLPRAAVPPNYLIAVIRNGSISEYKEIADKVEKLWVNKEITRQEASIRLFPYAKEVQEKQSEEIKKHGVSEKVKKHMKKRASDKKKYFK